MGFPNGNVDNALNLYFGWSWAVPGLSQLLKHIGTPGVGSPASKQNQNMAAPTLNLNNIAQRDGYRFVNNLISGLADIKLVLAPDDGPALSC